jgi:DNA-binding XRE family transcriptional regulator
MYGMRPTVCRDWEVDNRILSPGCSGPYPVGVDVPSKLRDLRVRQGLTQMQLAVAVGTTPARVSDWERARCSPSTKYVKALATALATDADEILEAIQPAATLN